MSGIHPLESAQIMRLAEQLADQAVRLEVAYKYALRRVPEGDTGKAMADDDPAVMENHELLVAARTALRDYLRALHRPGTATEQGAEGDQAAK